ESVNQYTLTHQATTVGTFVYALTVSDGIDSVTESVSLSVTPKNHPPVIAMSLSQSEVRENKPVIVELLMGDPDSGDHLITELFVDGNAVVLSGPELQKTYIFPSTSPGEHVFVGSVYDGEDTTTTSIRARVYPNTRPGLVLGCDNDYPHYGQTVYFTATATDDNAEEDLYVKMSVDGMTILATTSSADSSVVYSAPYYPTRLGVHTLYASVSDGDLVETGEYIIFVFASSSDAGDELDQVAAGIVSSLTSTITVVDGEAVINQLAERLSGQDLTGALRAFSVTVLGNGEKKNFSSSGIQISVLNATDGADTVSVSSEAFEASVSGVPSGHTIVMGTIPLVMDSNTPEGATGELISLDMVSGVETIHDGFEVTLRIENAYNSSAGQALYVQDPESGGFKDSGFSGTGDGSDLVFSINHFSVFVLVDESAFVSTGGSVGHTSVPSDPAAGLYTLDNGTGAGGGCFLSIP
ncbi:MAG: hypothetical protein HQL31_05960, partial [Planctomycetes bacterium]|nr:hypothetical protein [Planctomycetota bacterium]